MSRSCHSSFNLRKQLGSAITEYLPIVAIVLSIGVQVGWRTFGEELRNQGGEITTQIAGQPGHAGNSSQQNGDSNNPFGNGQGSGSGDSASNGSTDNGSGSGTSPGDGSSNDSSQSPSGPSSGSQDNSSPPGGGSGNGSGGNTQPPSSDPNPGGVNDDDSILEQAEKFVSGIWQGFRNQFWGLVELILHPIDSAKALYTLGEALVRDFDGTIAVIKEELAKDLAALTSGDPYETGRIIGENLSPAALAKVASKLSSIAKATNRLDTGCSSFTADTLVWTDRGKIPIQNVQVGTQVLARNDKTFEDQYQPVVQLLSREVNETYRISTGYDTFNATAEHPFWVQGQGWTPTIELRSGNAIAAAEGDILIRTITKEPQMVQVYNFEVANDHSYFVATNGLWVHNTNVVCDLSQRKAGAPTIAEATKALNSHVPGRQRPTEEINLLYDTLKKDPPYMPGHTVLDRIIPPGGKVFIIENEFSSGPGRFFTDKIYTNLDEARESLALPPGWKDHSETRGRLVMREYTVTGNGFSVRDGMVGPQDPNFDYPGGGRQFETPILDAEEWRDSWKNALDPSSRTIVIRY